MQYFGVPKCPYCKKRVNFIRTWSLKRQGEYRCPRCGGISNIFLSPLVYVFALLAVFCGGAVYFFHRFILDDVDLTTCLQVLIPFAVFFLLSLFMVYLAKPVIKKVPREEKGRKKRQAPAAPPPEPRPSRSRRPSPSGEYESLPRGQQVAGPQHQPTLPSKEAPSPRAVRENVQRTTVLPPSQQPPRRRPAPAPQSPAAQRRQAAQQTAQGAARRSAPPQGEAPVRQRVASAPEQEQRAPAPVPGRQPAPVSRPQAPAPAAQPQQPVRRPAVAPRSEAAPVQRASRAAAPAQEAPVREAPRRAPVQEPRKASRVVGDVELPVSNEDFFAKYNDPAYIERRLKELQEQQDSQ